MSSSPKPVLILGAGINGCAIARELLLNGVPVCVVDTGDVASGTTAYSSRLIHGGLRYLEYGEFDLVRESLAERTRLLALAPQFVRPLRLFVPVRNRCGGLVTSARRFLRLESAKQKPGFSQKSGFFGRSRTAARGLWLVRMGLWLYDLYARQPDWPKHEVHRVGDRDATPVDPTRYRWLCSYWDGQIAYPERFVLALVEDTRRLAGEMGCEFRLCTYHRACLEGTTVTIQSLRDDTLPIHTFHPSAIVNATGAWVDLTLSQLHVPSKTLMGGTKGSHFFTTHAGLRERLAGRAIYGEADDGRPVFILPLAAGTLVGTTDVPFQGDPASAVATPEELEYLLHVVNEVLPDVPLERGDIDWHYSGVRPLPYTGGAAPGSITRRHWLEENPASPVPLYSVIGGKLTTCRSLAEKASVTILTRLGLPHRANSRDRVIPGGEGYPRDAAALTSAHDELCSRFGLERSQIAVIWSLCGTRTGGILSELFDLTGSTGKPFRHGPALCNVAGTDLPQAFVRWVIRHEHVRTLSDLIERRLMLLYNSRIGPAGLREMAEILVEGGGLPAGEMAAEGSRAIERLERHFGKRIAE